MNMSKTIRERRTIRRFLATPVAQERIVSLLNEATRLYEAEGTPHWRCIYFGTAESRQRLADSMIAKMKGSPFGKILPAKMTDYFTKQVANTPAHLAFIAASADNRRQRDENYAAVCSIMQNVQLLGWEHGLGMLWYTEPLIRSESFLKEIGLREGERFAGILHIGYFDKTPKARKRTPAERNWTAIDRGDRPHSDHLRISSHTVLELLNDAVWAPNDGLREPWRFIYVTGGSGDEHASSSSLLFVAKEEADLHKQEEDYAAVCCVVQNFQLLARFQPWRVRRRIPEWIYDRERCKPFGIQPQERIVALLELGLGGDDRRSYSASAPSMPDITHL